MTNSALAKAGNLSKRAGGDCAEVILEHVDRAIKDKRFQVPGFGTFMVRPRKASLPSWVIRSWMMCLTVLAIAQSIVASGRYIVANTDNSSIALNYAPKKGLRRTSLVAMVAVTC